ncbi:Protein giant [Aphelenchoides bicaudatus]|nr:Protein giant [Aphelenchoides bicaudatus]
MASSLTQTTAQRSFVPNRFFPMDLSQSALYNLYANGNVNCLNQLVQSANFLGIKDVEPPIQSAFSFSNPFQRIDLEQSLIKQNSENMAFGSDTQGSPPSVNNELLNFCDNPLQNNLIFQVMPPSSSASSNDFLSLHLQNNSCDSDGSFSSSHSMNNETPKLSLNNNTSEKKRKELVRDEAYWNRRKKNNDAAKRSRDSRRKKEDEIAVRAALLEQENLRLRYEIEQLRVQIERHRIVALNSKLVNQTPFAATTQLQITP